MFQHLFLNLLIHGEGGDGGAGAAPGGAAPGAETSAEKAPVAGEQMANRRPNKAERRAALERQLEAERAAAQPQQNQQPQKQPWEEVKKLYKDEYGKDVQSAIQGRFKNQQDNQAELTSTKAELEEARSLLAQLAKEAYNIKPGADGMPDMEAIRQVNGRNRVEEYALENGVSDEYAEKALAMQDRIDEQDRKLREFEAAEEARRKDAETFAKLQRHMAQADAFRQKIPGFDLLSEMEQSPLFAHLLDCGFDVEQSFYAAHHEELMAAGQQAAADYATRALAANIQAGQSMPAEGGLGRTPAASPQRVMNFKGRSKAEREAFHKSVQRGDKHYF